MRLALFAAGLAWLAMPLAHAACGWQPLSPGTGKFTMNKLLVDLGEGDQTDHPAAWQGPVKIARFEGQSCTVDGSVSLVEQPIFGRGTTLLLTTFSGSNRQVFAVDGPSCKLLWRSQKFTGPVALHGDRLSLGTTHLPLGASCLPR